MFKDFKNFIARGNIMDLAVGVIIGSAFTGIIKSLTTNLINPLIGIFVGKIDLSHLYVKIGSATFKYGNFIDDVINFIILAFVVFLLVRFLNRLTKKQEKEQAEQAEAPKLSTSEQLLTDIKSLLESEQNQSQQSKSSH